MFVFSRKKIEANLVSKWGWLFLLITLLFGNNSWAQKSESDTTKTSLVTIKEHSPRRATLLSTALPGLGQAYNKKYWKIPIVYGAIGTSLFFAVSNNNDFQRFRTAFGLRVDGDANTIDEFDGILTDNTLESNLEFHQRNRDLAYIVAGLFYVLNIIDATVDAHLYTFPKNDKLSFNVEPSLYVTQRNNLVKGISLVIKL